MKVYLGVDGGGTTTAFVLIDEAGSVLAKTNRESVYYVEHGREHLARVLRVGTDFVCDATGVRPSDIAFAFFALPGYGEISADVPFLDEAPSTALGSSRYRCGNDMVAGWAGSFAGADGINVIAGTGSMAYGEREGRGSRVGGWGELLGDEGSAYWIGLKGLNAFTRMSDGRDPAGPLLHLIREETGVSSDLDLLDVVFSRWQRGRAEIAAVARVVSQAADQGDAQAVRILIAAADELVHLVDVTRDHLGFLQDEAVPVSYSGGVFKSERMRKALADGLHRSSAHYELRVPLLAPSLGAALHAAKLAGCPLTPSALRRLRHQQQPQ